MFGFVGAQKGNGEGAWDADCVGGGRLRRRKKVMMWERERSIIVVCSCGVRIQLLWFDSGKIIWLIK